jgi:hypothetical protein
MLLASPEVQRYNLIRSFNLVRRRKEIKVRKEKGRKEKQ